MKILALRVAGVGGFSAPVAVEGFSGQLDVLTGPNEAGKSTLLAALETVLFERHTSESKRGTLGAILPERGGGGPLIEVDLAIGGGRWRLRKRFHGSRSASLIDLGNDRIVAQGEEAHHQALAMLGAGSAKEGPYGLLWVRQGQSRALPTIETRTRETLLGAIEAEIAEIADGAETRRVRDEARRRLDELVTEATRRPRAGGPLAVAITRHDDLSRRLANAESRETAIVDRRARLAALEAERRALTDPAATRTAATAVAVAAEALRAAGEARGRRDTAEQRLRAEEGALAACRAELVEFDRVQAGQAALAVELEAAEAAHVDAVATQAEAAAAVNAAAARVEECEAERLAAGEQLERARDAELFERHRRAGDLAGEQARLERDLAACRVSDSALAAARREQVALDHLAARRQAAAAAPRVTVAYAEGATGRIRVGGRAVAEGEVLAAVPRLVLEVPGVGSIVIETGATAAAVEDAADLAAHAEQLANLLARMGVPDLAAAEAALVRQRDLAQRRAEAAAGLAALAPRGLAMLAEELTRRGPTAAASAAEPAAVPALTGHLDACTHQLGTARHEYQQATAHLATTERALARQEAAIEQLRLRLAEVAAARSPAAGQATERARLAEAVTAADALCQRAARDAGAWAAVVPDAAGMQRLEAAHASALEIQRGHAARLARILEEIQRIEGALEGEVGAGGDDPAELAEQVAIAAGQQRRLQDEAEALGLLIATLDAVVAQSRDRFLQPVTARLQPYLSLVLPAATAWLGGALLPEGIERGGVAERLERLSQGTQEQIAILVRLGFARLFADRGRPAPLILDDALIFSDDQRIESMFGALRMAAGHHQVIVATCRERSFAGLGGNRLRIEPWTTG